MREAKAEESRTDCALEGINARGVLRRELPWELLVTCKMQRSGFVVESARHGGLAYRVRPWAFVRHGGGRHTREFAWDVSSRNWLRAGCNRGHSHGWFARRGSPVVSWGRGQIRHQSAVRVPGGLAHSAVLDSGGLAQAVRSFGDSCTSSAFGFGFSSVHLGRGQGGGNGVGLDVTTRARFGRTLPSPANDSVCENTHIAKEGGG